MVGQYLSNNNEKRYSVILLKNFGSKPAEGELGAGGRCIDEQMLLTAADMGSEVKGRICIRVLCCGCQKKRRIVPNAPRRA
jgi:hypothetical protein